MNSLLLDSAATDIRLAITTLRGIAVPESQGFAKRWIDLDLAAALRKIEEVRHAINADQAETPAP